CLQGFDLRTLLLESCVECISLALGGAELGAQLFALAVVLLLDMRHAARAQLAVAQWADMRIFAEQRQLAIDIFAPRLDPLASGAPGGGSLDRDVLFLPLLLQRRQIGVELGAFLAGLRQLDTPARLVAQRLRRVLDLALELLARADQ